MSHPYKEFEPKWVQGEFPKNSYRSIFKWGEPLQIKAPKESLYKMLKEQFGLTDGDFQQYTEDLGFDEVKFDLPISLTDAQLDAFREIVGAEFVRTDDYARLSVAYGKTMYDLMRLRGKIVENVPDAVLYPDTKEQIERIVAVCAKQKIPLYVYGGGSSVTRGVECVLQRDRPDHHGGGGHERAQARAAPQRRGQPVRRKARVYLRAFSPEL